MRSAKEYREVMVFYRNCEKCGNEHGRVCVNNHKLCPECELIPSKNALKKESKLQAKQNDLEKMKHLVDFVNNNLEKINITSSLLDLYGDNNGTVLEVVQNNDITIDDIILACEDLKKESWKYIFLARHINKTTFSDISDMGNIKASNETYHTARRAISHTKHGRSIIKAIRAFKENNQLD